MQWTWKVQWKRFNGVKKEVNCGLDCEMKDGVSCVLQILVEF